MTQAGKRLAIVQYAGDFREAAQRLADGGRETYRGQRYTVEYVESLAVRLDEVTTIAGITKDRYDIVLPSGARAIGAGCQGQVDGRTLLRLVKSVKPDLLILRTPSRPLMLWAIRHRVRTLMLLADSVDRRSVKARLAGALTALLLRFSTFDVVANHGIRAARQLAQIGVPARKVVAWDYPAFDRPHDRAPKSAASTERRIFYVGLLTADKGVDDLIEAIDLLRRRGVAVSLELVGAGEAERLDALIRSKGLDGAVTLAGVVPNDQIIARMAAADVVVVPSRHAYSEGMPLTIYEAYCSRTPLVTSDHPMFEGNVVHGESGLVFNAGKADALADAIGRLLFDPVLYARLSRGGEIAWERLQIPVKWHDLIDRWLEGGERLRSWLRDHAMRAVG